MNDIPEEWLEAFNLQMNDKSVPHNQRPFLALLEWTRIHQCEMFSGSATEQKLFDWFYARSPAGSHIVPDMHRGVFYFDSAFWSARVPRIYGVNASINIDELIEMPPSVPT